MILVCGGLADQLTELVCARLQACGYVYRLLNMGVYPEGYGLCARWTGAHPEGYLYGPGWRHDLSDFHGVFARYLGLEGRTAREGLDAEQTSALFGELDGGVVALLEHLPCPVVNRIAGGMSNHSKPYQGLLVRRHGLLTPPTLVTSDPEEARRFCDEHGGEVIYKSLSGVRSIVRKVGAEHLSRLDLLRHAPAQFQALIPGDNVRVHTVDGRCFATRVHSGAVDYRYARRDGLQTEMEPDEIPPHVGDACVGLARELGLLIAGIDLKVTPEGDYYCFEINPSPGFISYELATGQPISAALAHLLQYGPTTQDGLPRKEGRTPETTRPPCGRSGTAPAPQAAAAVSGV
jgi:hypothetical protein